MTKIIYIFISIIVIFFIMEWLLKFLLMSREEKEKIIFYLSNIIIVSISSFSIYRCLFGDFIIQDFTFKNVVIFFDSKFLFFSIISFCVAWLIYFILISLQKKTAYFISKTLEKKVANNWNYNYKIQKLKRAVKLSKFLIRFNFIKKRNDKIILPKAFKIAKVSLTENNDKKTEAENSSYILSSSLLFLEFEAYYYTQFRAILWIFPFVIIYFFIIGTLFTFSIKNCNMMLAIIRSIEQFVERYEFSRDNK